jgi:lipopolysaccharide biosynthesis protein
MKVEVSGSRLERAMGRSNELKARAIALYLPQFHPSRENDEFWGSGFTEWTTVDRAVPLFVGHQQPLVPTTLGRYNLCDPATQTAQAALAIAAGLEGFCFWHYWFKGRTPLSAPLQQWMKSPQPQFGFCVGWANHSWRRTWRGTSGEVLIEQSYGGQDDDRAHFAFLESAFHDPRYLTVNGSPILLIFRPADIPQLEGWVVRWRDMAVRSGIPGLCLVARARDPVEAVQLSSIVDRVMVPPDRVLRPPSTNSNRQPSVFSSIAVEPRLEVALPTCDPVVIPRWDDTPRRGFAGTVMHGASPHTFRRHLTSACQLVATRSPETKIVWIKSWNEWGEGNVMEPDALFGHAFLRAARDAIVGPRSSLLPRPDDDPFFIDTNETFGSIGEAKGSF